MWIGERRYLETVDILYGSNTLILGSIEMTLYLGSLILPQRLQVMSSLELYWSLETWGRDRSFEEGSFWQAIPLAMSLLDTPSLPRLNKLSVTVDGFEQFYLDRAIEVALHIESRRRPGDVSGKAPADMNTFTSTIVLEPCDSLMSRFGDRMFSFVYTLPRRIYRAVRPFVTHVREVTEGHPEFQGHEQMWRIVPGCEAGYWIRSSYPHEQLDNEGYVFAFPFQCRRSRPV